MNESKEQLLHRGSQENLGPTGLSMGLLVLAWASSQSETVKKLDKAW